MSNFFKDNEDLQYYVNHELKWEPLVKLVEHQLPAPDGPQSVEEAVETYKEILSLVGQFAAEQIAPNAAEVDREGLHLEKGEVIFPKKLTEIFDQLKEMGLHGLCLPRELDGLNAPLMMYFLTQELIARGDVSVMTHHGFHGAIAMAMILYSVAEGTTEFDKETGSIKSTRFAEEIADIAAGSAWGCMDITEPNAGSDMAALSSKATQDKDGNWFVTGQKIFITSGHGKYHFVIARTESPKGAPWAGLEGLSLFLVPIYKDLPDGTRQNFATVDRLEEKLGHHASATCAITFENSPAKLVGKRGEGFKHMLLLMNNARLGVGFEGLGLCEAAYRLAKEYAEGRTSMGKTIDQHEIIADYLDEMRTDIQGLRALAVHGAYHEEVTHRLRMMESSGVKQTELERKRNQRRHKSSLAKSRRVTPLVKYLAGEKAVEMARRGLQIHGGVGYTREYGAEKLLRDSLVTPIYEGTSQIQALMAMKDTLTGVIRNPQDFVKRMAQARWRSISARDPMERRVARVQSLSLAAVQNLLSKTATDKLRNLTSQPLSTWPTAFLKNWNPKRDFSYAMLHAERLTKLLADAAICEVLYDQAQRHPERREVLERYIERAEPRCRFLHDEITTTGERILSLLKPEGEAESNSASA